MHQISPNPLTFEHVASLLKSGGPIELSEESAYRIRHCRQYLETKIAASEDALYGINTGFGSLCNVKIGKHELSELQRNLIQSHACGMGDEVPAEVVRLMLFLKIHSLSLGYSGVQLETVQRMVDFYNLDILPVVFQLGSLGASGDLAPLAHLSLPLEGLGEVRYKGRRMQATEALRECGLEPVELKAKEGLALLNGTQFCQAYGVWCILEANRLLEMANCCAALSLDAFDCRLSPFHDLLHKIRPHDGQLRVAAEIRRLLEGSAIAAGTKVHVQDPYAFRCVPQVHGASYGAIAHVQQVFLTEINAVTDNPTIFPDDDMILSGGNFHAQPLALALDYLAIALAELASISERRTYQLISGQRNLPPFLTDKGGLHSGFMIPQYTAAGIVSQNKQLCTPASVDSITSSNGQEDHVSMGANAATKAFLVAKNVARVLAVEWMTAAQAIDFRRPAKTSPVMENLLAAYREHVAPLTGDRILYTDLENTIRFWEMK